MKRLMSVLVVLALLGVGAQAEARKHGRHHGKVPAPHSVKVSKKLVTTDSLTCGPSATEPASPIAAAASLASSVSTNRPVGGATLTLWNPDHRGLMLGTSQDRSALTVGIATKF